MRLILLCLLLSIGLVSAQQPPYDNPPPAGDPYFRVRYEEGTTGNLVFPVQYTLWIPENVETLRGVIVHQHGCGEGSCMSGQTGAWDLHWQALAQKHDCALLAASYEQPQDAECALWCDPRNGSDVSFRKALKDLGEAAGHSELEDVPWALWGHSGGGYWAGSMTLMHPERVAAVWLRSGLPVFEVNPDRPTAIPFDLPDAALSVPMMCNPGTEEGVTVKEGRFAGVWPANKAFFQKVRGKGGLIGIAVDPLTGHACGNQRYMAIPWLDACLSARLPEKPGEPLQPMPTDDIWLAPLLGTEATPASDFDGEATEAVWLPNEAIAKAWMHYVRDTEISDETPPPAPYDVFLNGRTLTWEAKADLESGISHFIILHNGEKLAEYKPFPRNPHGRPVFQGLQYSDTPQVPLAEMRYDVPEHNPGGRNVYSVISVNTVGLESEAE